MQYEKRRPAKPFTFPVAVEGSGNWCNKKAGEESPAP